MKMISKTTADHPKSKIGLGRKKLKRLILGMLAVLTASSCIAIPGESISSSAITNSTAVATAQTMSSMPANVTAATASYSTRRDTLVDFIIDQAQHITASGSSVFGDFVDDGSTLSFRRIVAYLVNYKSEYLG